VLGSSRDVDLFAAPVALNNDAIPVAGAGTPGRRLWTARSGPEGYLAVTLNPALQSIWQETPFLADKKTTTTDLGGGRKEITPEFPVLGSQYDAFQLGNPLAFERFLRGRVVRVFHPGPKAKGIERTLRLKDTQLSSSPATADDERDTILIAGHTTEALDDFARAWSHTERLAADPGSRCGKALAAARGAGSAWQSDVFCGALRYNTQLSVLVEGAVEGRKQWLPLGTTVGSFFPPADMERCFAPRPAVASGGTAAPAAAAADGLGSFLTFDPSASLVRPVRIEDLGAGYGAPALYARRDCRLLGLPIMQGARVTW
jgi:hypothetical protein